VARGIAPHPGLHRHGGRRTKNEERKTKNQNRKLRTKNSRSQPAEETRSTFNRPKNEMDVQPAQEPDGRSTGPRTRWTFNRPKKDIEVQPPKNDINIP
jgi:hypothetical protein